MRVLVTGASGYIGQHLVDQLHRDGNQVACLFLDFDHFKRINDTLGHDAGDQLLQAVAQRLTSAVRESDTVARLGGDEFVVILPALDPDKATFEIMQWGLDAKQASLVDASRVTCPVLCMAGTRDKVNPPGTVINIAQRYKKLATFEELPHHSHWLIGEPGWEKIAARVADWFDAIHDEKKTRAKAG